MAESEFVKTFREIYKEYPEVFDALEEYDRTRKLRKIRYKERANFTIDARILRNFRAYCKIHGYNMSRLLEQFIRETITKK